MGVMDKKLCNSECGEYKPLDQFGSNKRFPDGKQPTCKDCRSKQRKAYHERHRDKENANSKKWQQNNKDKSREYVRKHREANPGIQKQYNAAYVERDPERVKELGRLKESRRRAAIREAEGEMPNGSWTALLAFYGSKCMTPDCEATEKLTLDHVVPIALGGMHDLRNAQVLCGPCNSAKQARHASDYRDIEKGILAGLMWQEPMILSRPKVIRLEPADLLRV